MRNWFLFILFGFSLTVTGQDTIVSKDRLQSTLFYYSYVDTYLDFYQFNKDQYQLASTSNGSVKLADNSFFNAELVLSNTWDHGVHYFTVGDISVSYTRNFYGRRFLKSGFQGFAATFKFILPTGKSEYLSGSDNWIFEPSLYYGWLLKDSRFFFTNKWRMNLSLGRIGPVNVSTAYLRFEPRVGYEEDTFWFEFSPDFRVIHKDLDLSVLLNLGGGIKVSDRSGFSLFVKQNVTGDRFYKTYLSLGVYVLL